MTPASGGSGEAGGPGLGWIGGGGLLAPPGSGTPLPGGLGLHCGQEEVAQDLAVDPNSPALSPVTMATPWPPPALCPSLLPRGLGERYLS